MKKSRFNLLIGLSSGIILIATIFFTNGLEDLLNQLTHLEIQWVIIAIICMFLYWGLEALILHSITKALYEKQRFIASFKVTMIGQFFNSVTPFASGGQPAQLYVLVKDGVEAGPAGSILMVKFIIYQSVLTIYSLAVILMKAGFFKSHVSSFVYVAKIGFLVNAAVIIFSLLFAKYKSFTHKFLTFIFNVLKFLRIVKDVEKTEQKIEEQLTAFHKNAAMIKNNLGLLFTTILLSFLQLTAFFVIPYCIYRSFGMTGVNPGDMVAAKAFVTMATAFIPLPGAAGGAEGSFYLFFSVFFSSKNIMAAILLWRLITYYMNIGVGGLVASLAPEKPLKSIES